MSMSKKERAENLAYIKNFDKAMKDGLIVPRLGKSILDLYRLFDYSIAIAKENDAVALEK